MTGPRENKNFQTSLAESRLCCKENAKIIHKRLSQKCMTDGLFALKYTEPKKIYSAIYKLISESITVNQAALSPVYTIYYVPDLTGSS